MKVTKETVSSKYRLDTMWIVYHYDPFGEMWIQSNPLNYYRACAMVREYRGSWDTRAQAYKA